MAEVFLSHDQKEDRLVALKIMNSNPGVGKESLARFSREFTVVEKLSHRNIVKLFGRGMLADGRHYYAMEYLKGRSLRELLAEEGTIDEKMAANILYQMLLAFSCFHEKGIVHRDLKPANIMLADEEGEEFPRVVITDFGLVRMSDATALTETGTVLGTPIYMSPELVLGLRADFRSDFYQLGVIAYEMLTGRPIVDGLTISELLTQIVHDEPKPIHELCPTLRAPWKLFFDRTLAKDREIRFRNVDEARAVIDGVLSGEKTSLGIAPMVPRVERRLEPRLEPRFEPWQSKKLIFTGLLIVCSIIFLSVFLSRRPRPIVYSVEELHLEATVHTLKAKWRSPQSYPSRIRLSGGGLDMVVEGDQGQSSNHHEVYVKGLQGGTSYSLKVVYPDGSTSLSNAVKTKKFRVEIKEAGFDGKSYAALMRLNTEPAVDKARLEIVSKNGVTQAFPAMVTKKGEVVVEFSLPPHGIEKMLFWATLPSGYQRNLDVKTEIISYVTVLNQRLATFNGKELVTSIHDKYLPKPQTMFNVITHEENTEEGKLYRERERQFREEGDRVVPREVAKKLRSSVLWPDYESAIRLAPLLFSSDILPLAERRVFHERLERFYSVFLYVAFRSKKPSIPLPDWGYYSLSKEPMSHSPLKTLPLKVKDGNPIVLGAGVPFNGVMSKVKCRLTFSLSNVKKYDRLELGFLLGSCKNSALRVTMNNLEANYLHCENIYSDWRIGSRPLYMQLPVDVLKEGKNELICTYANIFGHWNPIALPIDEVELRLYDFQ